MPKLGRPSKRLCVALVHESQRKLANCPDLSGPFGPVGHILSMNSRVHPKYKTKYRVSNWVEYDRALVQRGDITLWTSLEAADSWTPGPSGKRGGQWKFSEQAIEATQRSRLHGQTSRQSRASPANRFEFTPGWSAACSRPPAFLWPQHCGIAIVRDIISLVTRIGISIFPERDSTSTTSSLATPIRSASSTPRRCREPWAVPRDRFG